LYVPDVVSIPELVHALSGVSVYIGDGATITRPLVRKRDSALIGHAPITAQLKWCREVGIGRAIFTHCGSQIVAGNTKATTDKVRTLGRELSIDVQIAYDGMKIVV
jgi:hypothetical protein